MIQNKNFIPLTIRLVDQAVKDWFDKTVVSTVKTVDGKSKIVPSVFSQGERWAIGRTRGALRDENGVLMLPVISIRRTSIDPDTSQTALGVQTENIRFAREIDPKTGDLLTLETLKQPSQRLPYAPAVYEIYNIPYPTRVILHYELVVQTQYISQMNEILERIWRMFDLQKSFVMPIQNDGKQPYRSWGAESIPPIGSPYLVGFFEDNYSDAGNFEEMTDSERIIKYNTSFHVPAALSSDLEGMSPLVRVERTAYKLVIPEENVRFVDDPAELDKIFGPYR